MTALKNLQYKLNKLRVDSENKNINESLDEKYEKNSSNQGSLYAAYPINAQFVPGSDIKPVDMIQSCSDIDCETPTIKPLNTEQKVIELEKQLNKMRKLLNEDITTML